MAACAKSVLNNELTANSWECSGLHSETAVSVYFSSKQLCNVSCVTFRVLFHFVSLFNLLLNICTM